MGYSCRYCLPSVFEHFVYSISRHYRTLVLTWIFLSRRMILSGKRSLQKLLVFLYYNSLFPNGSTDSDYVQMQTPAGIDTIFIINVLKKLRCYRCRSGKTVAGMNIHLLSTRVFGHFVIRACRIQLFEWSGNLAGVQSFGPSTGQNHGPNQVISISCSLEP